MDKRFKNVNWSLPTTSSGVIENWQAVQIAVMMDIRDELKDLNRLLNCNRVPEGFRAMKSIDRRLAKHLPLKGAKR